MLVRYGQGHVCVSSFQWNLQQELRGEWPSGERLQLYSVCVREREGDKNTDSALSQHWTGSRARGPSFHLRTIIHLKCPVGMCICVRGHPSLRGLQKCLPRPDILQFQTKPFPFKDLTYLHSMFECVCVCCVMEAEGLFKKVNEPPWILTVRVEYSGFSRSYA